MPRKTTNPANKVLGLMLFVAVAGTPASWYLQDTIEERKEQAARRTRTGRMNRNGRRRDGDTYALCAAK